MSSIAFIPTKGSTAETEAEAKVFSVALHAVMSALLISTEIRLSEDKSDAATDKIYASAMKSLFTHVIDLYPDGSEMPLPIIELAEQRHLHCKLMGAIQ